MGDRMTKHLGLPFQKTEHVARAEFPCAAVADVDAVVDPEGIPGAVEVERTSGFTLSQRRPALMECERCQQEKMLGQAGSNPRRHDRPMAGKLATDVREGHLRRGRAGLGGERGGDAGGLAHRHARGLHAQR